MLEYTQTSTKVKTRKYCTHKFKTGSRKTTVHHTKDMAKMSPALIRKKKDIGPDKDWKNIAQWFIGQ